MRVAETNQCDCLLHLRFSKCFQCENTHYQFIGSVWDSSKSTILKSVVSTQQDVKFVYFTHIR